MEEDAGKSLHEGFADSDRRTYVDYNRSGVPLIEIVTEPDLRSADGGRGSSSSRCARMLVWLGVNDGNMEEGSLRCDANVSVRPARRDRRSAPRPRSRTSTRSATCRRRSSTRSTRQIDAARATAAGSCRRRGCSTRRRGSTVSMRSKEEAHDYRYFPEPDLPPLVVDAERARARSRAAMPELPEARRRALRRATTRCRTTTPASLTQSRGLADYFERSARAGGNAEGGEQLDDGRAAAHAEGARRRRSTTSPVAPAALGGLIALVDNGTISSTDGQGRLREDVRHRPRRRRDRRRARAWRRSTTTARSRAIVARRARRATPTRSRSTAAARTPTFGFLVGQVMKATGGKANPKRVNELLRTRSTLSRCSCASRPQPATMGRHAVTPRHRTPARVIELTTSRSSTAAACYALRDLTLTVDKGEFVFLTGPSGAGKSTLLRLLLRRKLPSEGDAHRRRPRPGDAVDAARSRPTGARVGFVFQDFKLIPTQDGVRERRVRDARARRAGRRSSADDVPGAEVGRPAASA